MWITGQSHGCLDAAAMPTAACAYLRPGGDEKRIQVSNLRFLAPWPDP